MSDHIPNCPATTVRLNCGCCDEVQLACHLGINHKGDHAFVLTEGFPTRDYYVTWREMVPCESK